MVCALMAALLLLPASVCAPPPGAGKEEVRPTNFIFLIDVSGSMVSKKTSVPAAGGGTVTLFDALRESLKGIIQDERLIGPKARVAFVTFGTAVSEKSDWPGDVENSLDRAALVKKIGSPQELQADKHGDTYMAGALDLAYQKAMQWTVPSEPCTTTFIVMLTDGWDEPPPGARLNVRQVAQKILARQQGLRSALGVNTWQVRVVGLQRLPDRKVGTTTAAELATMLGGEFLDVTKQDGGSVGERIFLALKKTISDLRGGVELAGDKDRQLADFGRMEGGSEATANLRLVSTSCYREKITGVEDKTGSLDPEEVGRLRQRLDDAQSEGRLKMACNLSAVSLSSELQPNLISFQTVDREFVVKPVSEQVATGGTGGQVLAIKARVDNKCPPGCYLGVLRLVSSAKTPEYVPYIIDIPSRIVVDPPALKVKVRKPGFLWNEPCKTELHLTVNAKVAGQKTSLEDIGIEPSPAALEPERQSWVSLLNGGAPLNIQLDTSQPSGRPLAIPVDIPAGVTPGTYQGALKLHTKNQAEAIAPADVKYTLEILPSAWEQVRGIAIPILVLLGAVVALGLMLTISGMKRS